jgi:serine/threonine protein kinase
MTAPITREEFFDLVRRSEVVEGERLDTFSRQCVDSGTALDHPKTVAEQMVRGGLLTNFQARQILAGKWRRFRIGGKYKLLEQIGAGGMGQVFLCEHVVMRRFVALKVLPADKLQDPSSLERFKREARAAASLDHPNIVRAFDIDQDEKTHFLVMEYVDGESLQNIVSKHGKLDVNRAANYIRQAALGLQHAHQAGLVHRDIKPGNLLVDRSGTVKVLDLGLARLTNERKDNLTEKYDEGAVLGTADYLAPEQAMHNKVDIRADIYSLGATFFFMLAGRAPFEDGTLTQKLLWHQIRKIPSVLEHRNDVPMELAAVIDKMLSKVPDDRYATPEAVAEALAPWANQPIEPPPDAWMPKRSRAASVPGAQGDAPGLGDSPSSRSGGPRSTPPLSRPSNSTPVPKTMLTPAAAPKLTAAREARRAEERRPRPKPASATNTKMILQIVGGSLASLAVIFGLVWAFTGKSESTPSDNLPSSSLPTSQTSPRQATGAKYILADQAKDHLGQYCVVELVVRKTGDNGSGRYFLNSLEDYRSPSCFTVTFVTPVFDELKRRGMRDLNSYFLSRTIRVTGTVTKYTNKDGTVSVQIDVKSVDQITS